jgi:hypothetical protein
MVGDITLLVPALVGSFAAISLQCRAHHDLNKALAGTLRLISNLVGHMAVFYIAGSSTGSER